jgi:hypothetical protein
MISSSRLVVVLCMFACAAQTNAAGYSWTYQRVDQSSPWGGPPQVSMAMRTGATWPTVFYQPSAQGGALVSSTLTPTGWSKTTLDSVPQQTFMRTELAPDGRVGAVWQSQSNGVRFGQFTSSGWQYSTAFTPNSPPSSSGANAPDLAYLSGNRPVVTYADPSGPIHVGVYNGLGWDSEAISYAQGGPTMGSFASTAVDSRDDIAVAYSTGSNVVFAQKSLGGTWSYADLGNMFAGSTKNLSLGFGPNDEVGMAVLYGSGSTASLGYAWFDIQSGSWRHEILAYNEVSSQRVNLTFDAAGHPSLSYVEYGGLVHYRTNDGHGWLDVTLSAGLDPATGLNLLPRSDSDVALAFDAAGLPVLSYYSGSSGLLLAYDPQITPEPATLLLLVGGVVLLGRRHRRA